MATLVQRPAEAIINPSSNRPSTRLRLINVPPSIPPPIITRIRLVSSNVPPPPPPPPPPLSTSSTVPGIHLPACHPDSEILDAHRTPGAGHGAPASAKPDPACERPSRTHPARAWKQVKQPGTCITLASNSAIHSYTCCLCHKSFCTSRALNGHTRIHGGHISSDQTEKQLLGGGFERRDHELRLAERDNDTTLGGQDNRDNIRSYNEHHDAIRQNNAGHAAEATGRGADANATDSHVVVITHHDAETMPAHEEMRHIRIRLKSNTYASQYPTNDKAPRNASIAAQNRENLVMDQTCTKKRTRALSTLRCNPKQSRLLTDEEFEHQLSIPASFKKTRTPRQSGSKSVLKGHGSGLAATYGRRSPTVLANRLIQLGVTTRAPCNNKDNISAQDQNLKHEMPNFTYSALKADKYRPQQSTCLPQRRCSASPQPIELVADAKTCSTNVKERYGSEIGWEILDAASILVTLASARSTSPVVSISEA